MKDAIIKFGVALLACFLFAFAMRDGSIYWNLLKWKSANIAHYRFHPSSECFCAQSAELSPTIEVQDGVVVSVRDSKGLVIAQDGGSYRTIDDLFSFILSSSFRKAYKTNVKYNPVYGFPSYISVDYADWITDDEIAISISGFEVLP